MDEKQFQQFIESKELTDEMLEQVSGGKYSKESLEWIHRNSVEITRRIHNEGFYIYLFNYFYNLPDIVTIDDVKAGIKYQTGVDVSDLD